MPQCKSNSKKAVKVTLLESINAILSQKLKEYKALENEGTSYNLGGPLYANVSGDVSLCQNYIDYGYSFNTQWDNVLKIGNNIKGGKALDLVTAIFEDIINNDLDGKLTITRGTGYTYNYATIEDGIQKVQIKYEYARSFSWFGVRLTGQ